MALRKLPPDVARELRRHISPRPLPKPGSSNTASEPASDRLRWVVGGCLALIGTAASFPLVASWWISLNEKDEPLTAAQVRRGAFNNSGTRDVGKDPNWDFRKGEYKKDAGYYAIFEEEKKKRLPGEFMAMSDDALKKHEEKIHAFAKGQAKNEK